MAKMVKSVRMSDIASALNVSTVTVSKALSGQKGVSEALREKIVKLAEEMGYQSSSASKKNNESYNIGVIISEMYQDYYDSFYWKMYQEVAGKAMQKQCFTMLEILSLEDERKHHPLKLVSENKVDGLIVIGKLSAEYIRYLKMEVRIPVMFLDFYDSDVSADAVISDGFYGCYLMTNYLFDHGHDSITYVGTLMATDSINDRYLGYIKSMMEHGKSQGDAHQINDRLTDNKLCDEEGNPILKLPEKIPDAFVCNCDTIAVNLVKMLEEQGLNVPEDVSVVGFDNFTIPGQTRIGITTYEVDITEMACRAVNTLIKKISGQPYRSGIQIVEGRLVEKDSVAFRN